MHRLGQDSSMAVLVMLHTLVSKEMCQTEFAEVCGCKEVEQCIDVMCFSLEVRVRL